MNKKLLNCLFDLEIYEDFIHHIAQTSPIMNVGPVPNLAQPKKTPVAPKSTPPPSPQPKQTPPPAPAQAKPPAIKPPESPKEPKPVGGNTESGMPRT